MAVALQDLAVATELLVAVWWRSYMKRAVFVSMRARDFDTVYVIYIL